MRVGHSESPFGTQKSYGNNCVTWNLKYNMLYGGAIQYSAVMFLCACPISLEEIIVKSNSLSPK